MKPNNPEDLEIWLRLYCAALSAYTPYHYESDVVANLAGLDADAAFGEFVLRREGMQS